MNLNELYDTIRVPNKDPSEWMRLIEPYVNEGESLPARMEDSDRWIRLTPEIKIYKYTNLYPAYLTHSDDTKLTKYYSMQALLEAHPEKIETSPYKLLPQAELAKLWDELIDWPSDALQPRNTGFINGEDFSSMTLELPSGETLVQTVKIWHSITKETSTFYEVQGG